MDIKIIYQNADFLVVDKPSGIIVHPWSECSDKISVLHLLKEKTGHYIYPVHRLDRPVSGVMIFAFSSEAAKYLKDQWGDEMTQKVYLGLCKGKIEEAKYISYPLWNQAKTKKQQARTNFWPLAENDFVTLALFKIATGRYHQIRRHCGAMGNQLIGDTRYGKGNFNRYYREQFNLYRLFLHCVGLRIDLGSGPECFLAPPPEELQNVLNGLNFNFQLSEEVFNLNESLLSVYSKLDNVVNNRDEN